MVAKKDEEIIRLSKNYEKLVDILDRAINPQMHSPFVTTTIEINNYIIKMRNNMVIDVIPRYSEDKKDFGDDNLRDHKKENRSLDKKNYKKCPYCSTKNDIDAKYCKECGMKPEKWDYSE